MGRASHPRANKGQGWLSMALWFHHTWFSWPLEVTWAVDINREPSCCRIADPNMTRGSSLYPDDILVPDRSTGHSYQNGSGGSLALDTNKTIGCNQTLGSCEKLVATWDLDFNTDPGCARTSNPDMILGRSRVCMSSLSQVAVMALGHQHGLRSWASTWPLMVTGTVGSLWRVFVTMFIKDIDL